MGNEKQQNTKMPGTSASPIKRLFMFFKERKKRKTLESIRGLLEFFGINTSEYSDEEIEQATVSLGKAVSSAGVTTAKAIEGFNKLNLALNKRHVCESCANGRDGANA